MSSGNDNAFEKAMARYEAGEAANELLTDFEEMILINPNNAALWTCLSWLQLLIGNSESALKSARTAVKLNPQDPQARVNLSLSLLETNSKGVRDHIELVKRAIIVMPEIETELKKSIADGLVRKPDWKSLEKVKSWLNL